MKNTRAQEVLYESEAALRLVDNELLHLRTIDADVSEDDENTQANDQASSEILAVLDRMREHRAHMQPTVFAEMEQRLLEIARSFDARSAAA